MNSNYGKNGTNNFDFDLGIRSNFPKSLNDQKNKSNSYSYMSSATSSLSQSKPATTTPSWQPGKPSWTHQPAPGNNGVTRSELGGPASMVGDIFGKSWNSPKPATSGQSVNIGVVNKNPNLFGDLVGSALGQNKSSSNVPLKSAAPVKSSFSMGGVADSLPKTNNSNVGKNGAGAGAGLGSSQSFASFGGATNGSSLYGNTGVNKSSSMGGGSMRSVAGGSGGGGIGTGMSSNKDPFGSLVDFSAKPMGGGSLNSSSKATASTSSEDLGFGDFQNASKSNTSTFPSGNGNSWGSSSGAVPQMDSFAAFAPQKNPAPVQPSCGDSFDMFFSPSAASGGSGDAPVSDHAAGGNQFSGGDNWGFESEYGGHDGGSTTEIEGLPPPPAGVSASTAKSKGLDNYKQGQFADAIKWLSWAEVLLEKAGEAAGTMEVLSCRASCYKEVGEYKKAVADCTKVYFYPFNFF